MAGHLDAIVGIEPSPKAWEALVLPLPWESDKEAIHLSVLTSAKVPATFSAAVRV